jgi:hypothetical protein
VTLPQLPAVFFSPPPQPANTKKPAAATKDRMIFEKAIIRKFLFAED